MSRIELGEVCTVFDGPHATPKKTETGPVYLGIDAITDKGKINKSAYNYLSEMDYKKWTKRVTPQYGDIVFSYEATLGRYALIPKEFYGCLGRRLAIVRPKDKRINEKWLYYYFLSPEWKKFIKNNTVKGSTVDRISIEDFPKYTIPLKDREEQDKIVKVLSAIDERIDINNRINDNLEQQIQLIYSQCIEQRKFPKHWAIQNDEAIIPLSQVCDVLSGFPFHSDIYSSVGKYRLITIKNVQDSGIDINVDNYIDQIPEKLPNYCILKPMDILMSLTGNVGRIGLMYTTDCLLNQRVAIIKPKISGISAVLYALFKSPFSRNTFESMATGTSQKNLSPVDVCKINIKYNKVLVNKIDTIIEPILKLIVQNQQNNQELNSLRDWLLPMLMNGQATIED